MSRTITRLRDDWKFTRTPNEEFLKREFDDSNWEDIKVPHDWAIAGPFDRENDIERKVAKGQADIEENVSYITGRTGGLPHMGEGWYRKWIDVPVAETPRCYRLECDGIMSHSTVYCNGEKVGGWPYGYTSFALDLSDYLKPGESNLIAVHVNNPEKASRWYPGGGIYRNVRLVELNPVHIHHWGIEITTPELHETHGTVQIITRVKNSPNTEGVLVRTSILNPEGKELIAEESNASETTKERLTVETPQRWSLENPVQYTVRSEIVVDGTVTDSLDTKFGFRTLRFDSVEGMFLNDEPIKMKGVCQHHDLGPLGAAVNEVALRRQLTMLKEMGCNAIRTSHNPPTPELPALASEMGILIIDEILDEWKHGGFLDNSYYTLWDEWAEKDLRALIRRDRNHPAVIMWSIGNEISEQWTEDGTEIAQFLVDICHDEDPTRPTTAGLNRAVAKLNKVAVVLDIPGWNYQPHDYVHSQRLYPGKPIYGAETASTVSSRGEYYFPIVDEIHLRRDTLQVNSYDLSCPSWATAPDTEFRAQDMCGFVLGEFVWTGFDYLGEPTPYNEEWPSRSSYFGIIDLGGIPKDRFYLYQSKWSEKKMIHLMPHWTWPGHEGKTVPVQCYSNYPSVELFVNGTSLGKQSHYRKYKVLASNYRFLWPEVPYEPGEIKVLGYDKDGKQCAERSIVTTGEPVAIELISDRTSLKTDGDDMAFVTVRIVDKDGNLCPRADNSMSFSIDGPAEISGLCNGDATSLESFKGSTMKAFNGMCVLYLGSRDTDPSDIKVTVSAGGLIDANIELKAE